MSVIGSVIFYNIVFVIILFFFKKGERNRQLKYLGILILILLSVLRFDIGNDYENYYLTINRITQYFTRYNFDLKGVYLISEEYGIEKSFVFFIWLFHKLDNTYVYVCATYSLITIYFWYKALKNDNLLFWGIFVIITLSILFNSFNCIRQGVSYAIFLYSIHFLNGENRNVKKYILYVLLASLFHMSAIFLLLILPVVDYKPRIKLYIAIIIILYFGSIIGLWKAVTTFVISNSFFYQGFNDSEVQADANLGSGIMFTVYTIMYSYCMYIYRGNKVYTNILFIGIVLFIIATGNLNINRFAYYFLNILVLIIPLYIKKERNNIKRLSIVFILLLMFQFNLLRGDGKDGCVPYDYIGSENFEKGRLRIRDYKDY